jgi:hypothetical protein
VQPGHAHPLPEAKLGHIRAQLGHPAHHLVPRNHRAAPGRQLALDHVQVGAADRAGRDSDAHLISRKDRRGHLAQVQRLGGDLGRRSQNAGLHDGDQGKSTTGCAKRVDVRAVTRKHGLPLSMFHADE